MRNFTETRREELIKELNEAVKNQKSALAKKDNYKKIIKNNHKKKAEIEKWVNQVWEHAHAIDIRYAKMNDNYNKHFSEISLIINELSNCINISNFSSDYNFFMFEEKIGSTYTSLHADDIKQIIDKDPNKWTQQDIEKLSYVYMYSQDINIKNKIINSFFAITDYTESDDYLNVNLWKCNYYTQYQMFLSQCMAAYECDYALYINGDKTKEELFESMQNYHVAIALYDVAKNGVIIKTNANDDLPIKLSYSYYDKNELSTINDNFDGTHENIKISFWEWNAEGSDHLNKNEYTVEYPTQGEAGENAKKRENEEIAAGYLGVESSSWFSDYIKGKIPKPSYSDIQQLANDCISSGEITNDGLKTSVSETPITASAVSIAIGIVDEMAQSYINHKQYEKIVENDKVGSLIDQWEYIYIPKSGQIMVSRDTVIIYEKLNKIIDVLNKKLPKNSWMKKINCSKVLSNTESESIFKKLQGCCEQAGVNYDEIVQQVFG